MKAFQLLIFLFLIVDDALAERTGVLIKEPYFFQFQRQACPPFEKVIGSDLPRELLSKSIECKVSLQHINLGDSSIDWIEYMYSIHQSTEYTERMQYNYLINKSDGKVLWRHSSLEGLIGSVNSVTSIRVGIRNFLEIQFFTGGTAGFWEEYWEYAKGGLRPISENLVESFKPLIPKTYSIQRVRIDLLNLEAIVYLSAPEDANCCPSKKLVGKLKLEGDDFKLVSSELISNESG